MNIQAIIMSLGLVVTTTTTWGASTWYVSTTGSDSNTGLTSSKALLNLQTAVTKSVSGDTIVIEPGTHLATGKYFAEITSKDLTINSSGGAASTILDCQNLRSGLVLWSDDSVGIKIKGLTFKNGESQSPSLSYPELLGGAVLCIDANTTFEDCVFESCNSPVGGGLYHTGSGGAVAILNNDVSFDNCVFTDNKAGAYGGAIYNQSGTPPPATLLTVTNCVFDGNHASVDGGGIAAHSSRLVTTLTDCQMTQNTAWNDGGAIHHTGGDLILETCSISDGSAGNFGGALIANGSQSTSLNDVVISNNSAIKGGGIFTWGGTHSIVGGVVAGNSAADGGGMLSLYGTVSIKGVVIEGNIAHLAGGLGAEDCELTTDSSSSGSPTVIRNNTAAHGGGVGLYTGGSSATVSLNNTTIVGNTVSGNGGGIFVMYSVSPTLTSCTLANNAAEGTGGGMYNDGNNSSTLLSVSFTGNSALRGGGVFNNDNGQPEFKLCLFNRNTAQLSGGAMYNKSSQPEAYNCIFKANEAVGLPHTVAVGHGGAVMNLDGTSSTFQDCSFELNTARRGGAIYNWDSEHNMADCYVARNEASDGAGIFNDLGSHGEILRTHVVDNVAQMSGGGVYNRDPGYFATTGVWQSLDFSFLVCEGNQARFGGGMYNRDVNLHTMEIINSEFENNTADQSGGGIANHKSSPTITSSKVKNNVSVAEGGGVYNESGSMPSIQGTRICYNMSSLPTLAGGGMFSDMASNPSVSNSNICLNGPDNLVGPYTDLGGIKLSCVDDGECNGNTIDPDPDDGDDPDPGDGFGDSCPGDITDDGLVNVDDFSAMLIAWGTQGDNSADIDGNGFVGVEDLSLLLVDFGTICPEESEGALPGDPRNAPATNTGPASGLKGQPMRHSRKQR